MNPTADTGATEFLANLSMGTVVTIALVLTLVRLALLRPAETLQSSNTAGKRPEVHPMARGIAEILESLIIAGVLVFLIIRPFFVQAFFIPSESMEPTLLGHDADKTDNSTGMPHGTTVHDHIFVNKLVYRYSDPKPNDIIVFKAPKKADAEGPRLGREPVENVLIKRLIAVGPATVEIKEDGVYVDDKRIPDEPAPKGHIKEMMNPSLVPGFKFATTTAPGDNETPGGVIHLKAGQLWVMGDNRNDSNDSRYWGPLDRNRVIGKANLIFFPLNRLQMLP